MLRRKFIRVRSDRRRLGRYQAGNPLWPLEELHDLHKPPFVAEPEFAPFDIDALRCNLQSAPALPGSCTVRREFPIPQLVAGLTWRFAQHIKRPVVPEVEFAPLDLRYVSR